MARRLLARPAARGVAIGLIVLLVSWMGAAEARAQADRSVPSDLYLAAFGAYYDGEYKDALRGFESEGRGAIKTPQSRWIDSICYETMVGECYYQMGHLQQALEHYTAAVKLYVAFSDWMLRVKFPPAIRPSNARPRVPWGTSTRGARLGQYPTSMLIGQGRIDQKEAVQHGGIVNR